MTTFLLCIIALLLWSGMTNSRLWEPKDDTDPPSGRSGVRLFIDARTGCHYLGNPMGGITPRLNAEGVQICNKRG